MRRQNEPEEESVCLCVVYGWNKNVRQMVQNNLRTMENFGVQWHRQLGHAYSIPGFKL